MGLYTDKSTALMQTLYARTETWHYQLSILKSMTKLKLGPEHADV